jgi:preprotein translocase subunit SecE
MSVSLGVLVETENRKYTILTFFLLSAICGYVLYLTLTQVADWMKFGGSNAFGLGYPWPVVGGAISAALGLVLFIGLSMNTKATTFFDEVFSEVFKVTWPTFKETSASTVVVTVMVLVATLILAMMDYFWGAFFNLILNKL